MLTLNKWRFNGDITYPTVSVKNDNYKVTFEAAHNSFENIIYNLLTCFQNTFLPRFTFYVVFDQSVSFKKVNTDRVPRN